MLIFCKKSVQVSFPAWQSPRIYGAFLCAQNHIDQPVFFCYSFLGIVCKQGDTQSEMYHIPGEFEMSNQFDDTQKPIRKKRGPRWSRLFAILLSIILALVIASGVLIYLFGHNLFVLTNYISASQKQEIVSAEELPEEARETVKQEERKGSVVGESELDNIHQKMNEVDTRLSTLSNEAVYNLLLVGVDRRDDSWYGNSDSMILVSINFQNERVSVISLMRDTYVNIPEVGYNKLNNSYARGGGQLLCSTVTENFNIDVSRYAAVDFESMVNIIDAMGGIELEMTAEEIAVANGYMVEMCDRMGLNSDEYIFPLHDDIYVCNGIQAVAYARNRYVGNSDYARTERQRYVISKMIYRLKQMNVAELMRFARKVLPLITHNITERDIWNLIPKAATFWKYTFVQDRVPYDGRYSIINVDDQDMLVPDWEETIEMMHETIYGSGSVSNNQSDITDDNYFDNEQVDRFDEVQTEAGAAGL